MKKRILLEVTLVFMIYAIVLSFIGPWLKVNGVGIPFQIIAWSLFSLLFPLAMIILTRVEIGHLQWKRGIHYGFFALGLGLIQSMGFALASRFDPGFHSLPAMAILLACVGAMIILLLWIFSRSDDQRAHPFKRKLWIMIGCLALPPLVVGFTHKPILPTLGRELSFLFPIALGEELMFRGYVQSRLNRAFGLNWKTKGVHFGPGLAISSLFFGLFHLNAFTTTSLNWPFALAAVFAGLFFGLLREKGGIWAAFAFHAFWSAIPEPIMIAFGVM